MIPYILKTLLNICFSSVKNWKNTVLIAEGSMKGNKGDTFLVVVGEWKRIEKTLCKPLLGAKIKIELILARKTQ